MVTILEDIRLRVADAKITPGAIAPAADQLYADAFRKYGIAIPNVLPEAAADRIRSSEIRETLLSFLHDWLHDASDANRATLQAVADQADTNDGAELFDGP